MASGKYLHETDRKLRPLRSFSCDVYSGYSNIALRRAMKPSPGVQTSYVHSSIRVSQQWTIFSVTVAMRTNIQPKWFMYQSQITVREM